MGCETERKFLIEYPDISALEAFPGSTVSKIVQTYLLTDDGMTSRVRVRTSNGACRYYHTAKKRINDVRCIENEREISAAEYEEYLKSADPERRTIHKIRYCLPYNGRIVEVDIYPYWSDRAITEVELEDENEEVHLPDCIKVIREVTSEKAYKNFWIAKKLPTE